ncbi:hypothetical protein [Streptomyces sp. MS2.AVA.5]|uniref:Uncharacterized protein n=1 Tax=Streptomyces achmelvichensis TaxID=3134111 RepID=A0ACC6PKJ0_9ACTN
MDAARHTELLQRSGKLGKAGDLRDVLEPEELLDQAVVGDVPGSQLNGRDPPASREQRPRPGVHIGEHHVRDVLPKRFLQLWQRGHVHHDRPGHTFGHVLSRPTHRRRVIQHGNRAHCPHILRELSSHRVAHPVATVHQLLYDGQGGGSRGRAPAR